MRPQMSAPSPNGGAGFCPMPLSASGSMPSFGAGSSRGRFQRPNVRVSAKLSAARALSASQERPLSGCDTTPSMPHGSRPLCAPSGRSLRLLQLRERNRKQSPSTERPGWARTVLQGGRADISGLFLKRLQVNRHGHCPTGSDKNGIGPAHATILQSIGHEIIAPNRHL